MDFVKIANATRNLGKPLDWDDEKYGPCGSLPIRDGKYNGVPAMTSAWKLTPAEIEALANGAELHLMVVGEVHPPVAMYVTPEGT